MPLHSLLVEKLRCPAPDHGGLTYDETGQTVTCASCGRVFPVNDGVAVLVFDEPDETADDDLAEVR